MCPYYTMFPLSFPLRVLRSRTGDSGLVADPFCGRGTTNFAARLLGYPTIGVDSSPVAVALTQAKMADARPGDVVRVARSILDSMPHEVEVPEGEFWRRAYAPEVLRKLCWFRQKLLRDCRSPSRTLLRAILLGALHGPRTKSAASHLSNQCPRTFAAKPDYAIRFWRKRRLEPPEVNVVEVVRTRAHRYLDIRAHATPSEIIHGDSRMPGLYDGRRVAWVITSPPYYGMRTYIADQWLRHWFLGGPATVEYERPAEEIAHTSPTLFAGDLQRVWKNLAENATTHARLVIRFGGIADRDADPVAILKASLQDSGWWLVTVRSAGDANAGRRQAAQFARVKSVPQEEYDFYAVPA